MDNAVDRDWGPQFFHMDELLLPRAVNEHSMYKYYLIK